MNNKLTHCMCGCIYEEPECPRCNKITDKDRIEELEAKLAKAVEALKVVVCAKGLTDPTEYGYEAITFARTTLAELTGGKDE